MEPYIHHPSLCQYEVKSHNTNVKHKCKWGQHLQCTKLGASDLTSEHVQLNCYENKKFWLYFYAFSFIVVEEAFCKCITFFTYLKTTHNTSERPLYDEH